MPRSEEAEWWANAVYAAVQEIPHGKVTSYGHIALLLGERISSSIQFFMKSPRTDGEQRSDRARSAYVLSLSHLRSLVYTITRPRYPGKG